MPLPMQGDELLPGQQNIVRGGRRPRAPDRGRGDRALDAVEEVGKAAFAKLRRQRRPLGFAAFVFGELVGEMMGEDVDQGALELLCVGMAELSLGELLEMLVQQPGMVDRRLQYQRFTARDRGAMAAMQGACRKLC